MLRHVLFAVIALVLAAQHPSYAQEEDAGEGEYAEEYNGPGPNPGDDDGHKKTWRERFQKAQGFVTNKQTLETAKALKEQYGTLSEEQAAALRERAASLRGAAGDRLPDIDSGRGDWEGWKAAHPELVAKLQGSDEERRKQWAEWREDHRYDADKIDTQQETLRQKWDDWKAARASDDPYTRKKATEYFKFNNRDEAIEGMNKYKDWSRAHPDAAQKLKDKAAELRGTNTAQ